MYVEDQATTLGETHLLDRTSFNLNQQIAPFSHSNMSDQQLHCEVTV